MKRLVLLMVISLLVAQAGADDMWTQMYEQQLVTARNGDAEAQYSVAGMYKNGQGVKVDRESAVYWYTKASEQNHDQARAAIALMQANERKFRKTRKIAESGNIDAQYKLASMYESGKGTDTDPRLAVQWFTAAAEKGHAKAQYSLARIFHANRENSSDGKVAFRWFLASAEQGYSPAQFYLGEIYLHGRDVKQNHEEALAWFRKAAEGGYGPAYKGINKAEAALQRKDQRLAREKEEALINARLSAEQEHAKALSSVSGPSPAAEKKPGPTGVSKQSETAKVAGEPRATANSMKQVILNGNWVRGKAPSVFLPSNVNQCIEEKSRIVCSSKDLDPSRDGSSRYRVRSIITGIDAGGAFLVVFRRLDLASVSDTSWTDVDDNTSASSGGWSEAMNVQCELKKGLSITCKTSLGRTTEFKRSTQTAKGTSRAAGIVEYLNSPRRVQ